MPTALVTGAGRGIGRGIALRLAKDGFEVVVADLDADLAAEVAAEVGGRPVVCDVAEPDAVTALAADVPLLDVLVNNAGIYLPGALLDVTPERFHKVMDVNVLGPLLLSQTFAPALEAARGCIVNIASMSAVIPVPGIGVYSASKAALASLTSLLALELAPRGIRVNAVAPGRIETEGTADRRSDPAREERTRALIPAGRVGTPEDIARTVSFLASAEADYITGQTILVDGGLVSATVPFFQAAQG